MVKQGIGLSIHIEFTFHNFFKNSGKNCSEVNSMIFRILYQDYRYRRPEKDHVEIRLKIPRSALEKLIQDAMQHPDY
jgi:hypothetical protein